MGTCIFGSYVDSEGPDQSAQSEILCLKYQIMFSGENIISVLFAELVHRVVTV